MKSFSEKEREYKRYYYYNVLKPQKRVFMNWLRKSDPKEIWRYFDIKIE